MFSLSYSVLTRVNGRPLVELRGAKALVFSPDEPVAANLSWL